VEEEAGRRRRRNQSSGMGEDVGGSWSGFRSHMGRTKVAPAPSGLWGKRKHAGEEGGGRGTTDSLPTSVHFLEGSSLQ